MDRMAEMEQIGERPFMAEGGRNAWHSKAVIHFSTKISD